MDATALISQIQALTDHERKVVASLLKRQGVARDMSKELLEQRTLGERVADQVASFGGSWRFIFLFLGGMAVWMALNVAGVARFDAFPFILLNLVLSCVASLQAPVIMMSQNRQAARDRLEARHDYEVNLKAEMEIMALHGKVDQLRDQQWRELVELQNRQVQLLEEIRLLVKAREEAGG
jgi:uncharacterized membrane protein